ncbi:MAG: AMP-binding protein [Spirochaetaceae bacterium]
MYDRSVKTLHDLVYRVTGTYDDRPALCGPEGSCVGYAELRSRARAVAAYLTGLGVSRGDRIALLAENGAAWGLWYFGVASCGAVIVPILTDFSAEEVKGILTHAEPKLVVTSERTSGLTEPWQEATAGAGSGGAPRVDHRKVFTLADQDDEAPRPVAPDDPAALIYTSGTTGSPKGVILSHRNLVTNAQAVQQIFDVQPHDRLLSVLPLAHTYECTIGFLVPLLSGASVHYLGAPPTPSVLLPALERVRPSIMLVVPLIIEKVYRSRVAPRLDRLPGALRRFPLSRIILHRVAARKLMRTFGGRLRVFGIGGAPLAPDAERFLRDGRFPYTIGYGLTETAPLLAGTAPYRTRYRSTGPAVPGVELRLDPAADGPVTELQARGPNVMLGYYKDTKATAASFTEDGWFKTGDLARMDADGYVYIQGRVKTLIVGPSGENIYPEEIEATIEQDPLVEESLVVSRGNALIARVRLNVEALAERLGTIASELDAQTIRSTGAELLEELRRSVNARLNRFSRIAQMVLQQEALERTPTRKVKRFLYEDDGTADSPGGDTGRAGA